MPPATSVAGRYATSVAVRQSQSCGLFAGCREQRIGGVAERLILYGALSALDHPEPVGVALAAQARSRQAQASNTKPSTSRSTTGSSAADGDRRRQKRSSTLLLPLTFSPLLQGVSDCLFCQRLQDCVALGVWVHSVIADSLCHLPISPGERRVVIEKDEVR